MLFKFQKIFIAFQNSHLKSESSICISEKDNYIADIFCFVITKINSKNPFVGNSIKNIAKCAELKKL